MGEKRNSGTRKQKVLTILILRTKKRWRLNLILVYISKHFDFPMVAEQLMYFHCCICIEYLPSLPCLHSGSLLTKTTRSDLFPVPVLPFSLFFLTIFCRFYRLWLYLSVFVIYLKASTLQTLSSPHNIRFTHASFQQERTLTIPSAFVLYHHHH